MWEPNSKNPAQGGFVIRIPGTNGAKTKTFYSSHVTPEAVLKKFVQGKKQYIGQLELLYAVAVYTSAPKLLANRQVIHFIDNTSAVAGLVKGYSRAIDSGRITNAFHAFNAGLRAMTFFEYIRSKANIADLPSRGGMEELKRVFREADCFGEIREIKCRLPEISAWHDHASTWIRRGIHEKDKQRRPSSAARSQNKRRRLSQ
jgi:hypothetical protein